jgi:hypothetical protein
MFLKTGKTGQESVKTVLKMPSTVKFTSKSTFSEFKFQIKMIGYNTNISFIFTYPENTGLTKPHTRAAKGKSKTVHLYSVITY